MNPESSPDEQSLPHWPGNWPGILVVDLDNLGDPGIWITEQIPDVAYVLFGNLREDDQLAEGMAEAYIGAACNLVFPLPSDHGTTEEQTREMVKSDFLGSIREWRKRALAAK